MEGQNIVSSVIGPIAHSNSDLQLLVETLLDAKPWERDPGVLPLPWRSEVQAHIRRQVAESRLCFGVMRWDGVVMPHPPIQRAIDETVVKLKMKGHEVCASRRANCPSMRGNSVQSRLSSGRLHLTPRLLGFS